MQVSVSSEMCDCLNEQLKVQFSNKLLAAGNIGLACIILTIYD